MLGDQRRELPHHEIAGHRFFGQHLQHFFAVEPQQYRLLEALGLGDAPRVVFEQGRPAEHLALAQHEPGHAGAVFAADHELDATRFQDVQIVGRVAHVVERALRVVLLAARQAVQPGNRRIGHALEQLRHLERARLHHEDLAAFVLQVVALERRLGLADGLAGGDVPLPQVLVTGEHGAVEEALVEAHVLMRAKALVGVEVVARVDDEDLDADGRVVALHPVRRDVAGAADSGAVHAAPSQLNLS